MELIPPHNIEAEEAILGGILLEPSAIAKVGNLEPDHFYVPAHQKIWKVFQRLSAEEIPIDLIHFCQALPDDELGKIGGVVKLTNLMDLTLSAVNIDRYAAIVKRQWQRRKLISNCHQLINAAYDQGVDWDSLKTEAEAKLSTAIADQSEAKGLRPISDFLPAILDDLQSGKNPGTPTGLPNLDQFLGGGIRDGELVVVAARPSMGKTFVGQFFSRILAELSPVAFFSCEMGANSIIKRFLATEAEMPQTYLTANAISGDRCSDLITAMGTLAPLPLYIDDTDGSRVTMPYLTSECHKIYRKHGNLGLVVVDYLQLIGDQTSINRTNELSRISKALKGIAKQFNCPVIALSQLSRGVESRNDKRPVMSDIRASGAIEEDADVILMLYRDEYYNRDSQDAGILELIIAKNRLGSAGVTAKVEFDPAIGTIKPYVNYSMGA